MIGRMVSHRLFWPSAALVLLLLAIVVKLWSMDNLGEFVTIRNGGFYGTVQTILRTSAPLLLISLGMTLVIATRGIDLSVGAVAAIAGAVALKYVDSSDRPGSPATALTACALALGLCLLLGAWNGFLVAVLGIQPIIATLVLMTAGRGIAMLITQGFITTVTSDPYARIANGFWVGIPIAMILATVIFVAVALLTRRTALGMLVEAIGINPAASRLAGIGSRSITWTVYILCALFSGLAGLIISSNTMAADANSAGLFIELDAILAVVIGGTSLAGGKFSLSGTLVGVLVLSAMTQAVTMLGVPVNSVKVFKGLVVLVVCVLQSPVVRRKLGALRRRPPTPIPAPGRVPAVEGTVAG